MFRARLKERPATTTIDLSATALARTRFAISCLWEVVASLRVLHDGEGSTLHADWVRRTSAHLPRCLPADSLLVTLARGGPRGVPGFLTPPARGLAGDLETELHALASTPRDAVKADVQLAGLLARPGGDALARDPSAGLRQLVDEIAAYWDCALAEHWSRIRTVLEAEVFRGARLLAEEGVGAVLRGLHDSITWDGSTLKIDNQREPRSAVDADELILVPSCFNWPSVVAQASGTSHQIVYPARGVGAVWEPSAGHTEDLAAVLGRCRARLLAELEAPASTSDLALRTGMSIGGTSDNLSALRAAGLVARRRHGKRVLSVRTPVADALVARRGRMRQPLGD
jgi:hypothetical protein